MEQIHAPEHSKIVKSETAREVSGETGKTAAESAEALRGKIAEKQASADRLRGTWQAKFEAFKKMKSEHDQQLAIIERLKISGKISDETFAAEKRSMLEKLEMTMEDAKKYRDDAEELEAEIEKMNAQLEDSGN